MRLLLLLLLLLLLQLLLVLVSRRRSQRLSVGTVERSARRHATSNGRDGYKRCWLAGAARDGDKDALLAHSCAVDALAAVGDAVAADLRKKAYVSGVSHKTKTTGN